MSDQLEPTLKLGFGLMRLPRKGMKIDVEQFSRMVDLFMEGGGTYYDTAYVYPGSEEATRKALVERYPRESYTLATKVSAWLLMTNEKAVKEQFYTSLKRTGAGYFDYYLLHCLMDANYKSYDKFHIWDYVKELKEKGLIKHFGFSYHAGPKLLDQLLTAHPEVDFVQLQINYADWENPHVNARANYEVARKHGKPIVVMEPVKGGKLANPPKKIQELMKAANPNVSYASYAIRFVASLEGVHTVLSGMSNMEQMEDNLSYMRTFQPLDEEERTLIRKAQEILGREGSIPCTACRYCMKNCPKQIPIPDIFAAMNLRLDQGNVSAFEADYVKILSAGSGAADCIHCGQCEAICPQHLEVRKYLDTCKDWSEKLL